MASQSTADDQEFIDAITFKMQRAKLIIDNMDHIHSKEKNQRIAVAHITGFNIHIVDEVFNSMWKKKTFFEWNLFKSNERKFSRLTYERIREILFDEYVTKLKIPTKASLVNVIIDSGFPSYTYMELDNDLKVTGYSWKRLLKTNKNILLENAEQVANRHKYLHKMIEYRDSKRPIVHLELAKYLSKTRRFTHEVILVASPCNGLIDIHSNKVTLDHWLQNKLYMVPKNSVFVIEDSGLQSKDICERPTIYSKKEHMKDWLDTYNIPYDSSAHKAELYTLIQKYNVHCEPLNKHRDTLKAAGYDVLMRPPELANTNYFNFIYDSITQNKKTDLKKKEMKRAVSKFIEGIKLEKWCMQDRIMAEKEREIYNKDIKMDLIVDKIIETVKHGGLDENDLEKCENEVYQLEYYKKFIC